MLHFEILFQLTGELVQHQYQAEVRFLRNLSVPFLSEALIICMLLLISWSKYVFRYWHWSFDLFSGLDPSQFSGLNNENGSGISDASASSAMSGRSNVSDKTYITEESSLVLECRERGVLKYDIKKSCLFWVLIILIEIMDFFIFRHYLIPYHTAKKGKFGKRGTKLHIFMDHVFVAQHIKRWYFWNR